MKSCFSTISYKYYYFYCVLPVEEFCAATKNGL